ncbi:hypothetical protein OKA04_07890 [Luteolibacter flavescens]|uniref:Uncharacterized protein n=1 Tax=Luteolibacter flavescens TaxID=1859460 RepID=A0ABT3FM57_9BACT|nr:hypothetical protein [Luteolibacter flavescens]MCW1884648.1 hypothetical protein [Luteolibacter flavescens]
MDLLLEFLIKGGFLLDALGVIGLGFVGVAAVRLANRYRSWGGSLIASGALMLLLGRLWVIAEKQLMTSDMRMSLGEAWTTIFSIVPMGLLTMGLACVVWGLWGHEQWLREER